MLILLYFLVCLFLIAKYVCPHMILGPLQLTQCVQPPQPPLSPPRKTLLPRLTHTHTHTTPLPPSPVLNSSHLESLAKEKAECLSLYQSANVDCSASSRKWFERIRVASLSNRPQFSVSLKPARSISGRQLGRVRDNCERSPDNCEQCAMFSVEDVQQRTWLSGKCVGIRTRTPWDRSPGGAGWLGSKFYIPPSQLVCRLDCA